MFKKTKVTLTETSGNEIDWTPYLDGFINPQDKNLLDDIKFLEGEELTVMVEKSAQQYVELFRKVLKSIHQVKEITFILQTLNYLLKTPSLTGKFLVLFCISPELTYAALLENINSKSSLVIELSYTNITLVFQTLSLQKSSGSSLRVREGKSSKVPSKIISVIESINSNLKKYFKNTSLVKTMVTTIMNLLKEKKYRRFFYTSGGLKHLVVVLRRHYNDIQVTYEVCFCYWMMSYETKICGLIFGTENDRVIPILHHLLKINTKEKIRRVILLTFKNFLQHNNIISILINLGVYKTLQMLSKKNFEDDDIDELFKLLIEKIYNHIEEISSFSEYRQEVMVGNLEWSPVHKSEKFWKESIKKFEENDYFMIKKLVALLDSNDNNKNLAICCFDLGQLIRFYPRAKKILTRLNAKGKILGLMNHKDEEVKKHALGAIQKLLIQKWEYL